MTRSQSGILPCLLRTLKLSQPVQAHFLRQMMTVTDSPLRRRSQLELIQIILTLTVTESMTVTKSLQEPILLMLTADLVTTLKTSMVLKMELRTLVMDQ